MPGKMERNMQGWGCVLERHVSISWLGGRVRNTHLIWCVVMVGTVLHAVFCLVGEFAKFGGF